ncbi:hypothetical protein F5X68DRAFT_176964 [Plectosphaerella plurivora]|uniref:Uncharacterized protein n=1 Tax=Plectosphaerella plurivora TaxID=936078 RepID=A0A9P8V2T5_9PEZI|nr:hypothetical protein F5X68DRAFT_176964 [Plectosphaerella plurivora]
MAIARLGATAPRCMACRALIGRHLRHRGIASASAAAPSEADNPLPTRTTTSPPSRRDTTSFLSKTTLGSTREKLGKHYFRPTSELRDEDPGPQGKPPDENRANLGRTLRILQDHLPTLLQTPLQQDLLAPNISLHLFPSTHPHLPTVSGRVAYTAALWTSPIAWNRVPVIGNVKLSILSARVTKEPVPGEAPMRTGSVPEKLVVRWCTCGAPGDSADDHVHNTGSERRRDRQFSGLFIFQFDQEGRILSHTIETIEGGGNWEKGVGAKVVGLTDWLLGGLGRGEPSPAFSRVQDHNTGKRSKS